MSKEQIDLKKIQRDYLEMKSILLKLKLRGWLNSRLETDKESWWTRKYIWRHYLEYYPETHIDGKYVKKSKRLGEQNKTV